MIRGRGRTFWWWVLFLFGLFEGGGLKVGGMAGKGTFWTVEAQADAGTAAWAELRLGCGLRHLFWWGLMLVALPFQVRFTSLLQLAPQE